MQQVQYRKHTKETDAWNVRLLGDSAQGKAATDTTERSGLRTQAQDFKVRTHVIEPNTTSESA